MISSQCLSRAAPGFVGFALAGLAAGVLLVGCGSGAGLRLPEVGEAALDGYSATAPAPSASAEDAGRFAPPPRGAGEASPARLPHPRPEVAAHAPPAEADADAPDADAPDGFLDPVTRDADRVPMALEACLRRALANNLKIQIARFGPAIAGTHVVEAEALFDPAWYLNNALGRVRQDAGTFLAGADTLVNKQWDFDTGLEALLPTGATISLGQDWTYLDSNSTFFMPNPQYDTDLSLEVRQPLLRGAGLEVTKSPIVLARLDHRVSLADFKARIMDTLLEVERAYWDLAVAQVRVRALTEALEAAEENRRIARRRHEQGKARRVAVSLAESAVTRREADLVAARLVLAQTSDRLKRLLNDPALPLEQPALLKADDRPTAEPVPVGRRLYRSSLLAAMKHRPEMDRAAAELDRAALRERVARNQRLPRLDLAAGYTLNGLDSDLGPGLGEAMETTYFDWQAGLEFRIPVGNRARTAAHERSRLERAVAARRREDTRQQILLEVSQSVRDVAAAEESILATRAAREAAEHTLRDQQANVAAGAALQKDLLEAQRDLADARVAEIRAMADYMIALAELERAKGTLLAYNHIQVMADPPGPRP